MAKCWSGIIGSRGNDMQAHRVKCVVVRRVWMINIPTLKATTVLMFDELMDNVE
jgi:hypothetical protein